MSPSNKLKSMILKSPIIQFKDTNIYMKCENLQAYGSYKIRGVAELIYNADPQILNQGLVVVSAGNMAQVVAYAGKILNVPVKVYLPTSAPDIKKNTIQKIGAKLIEEDFVQIWNYVAAAKNPQNKGVFVHPFKSVDLIKGYGSILEEIISEVPDCDAIVIPFGVGGLSLGISRKLKLINPSIKIYLVEPSTSSPMASSFINGRAMKVDRKSSFIDAIGTPEVFPEIFDELSKVIHNVITVTPEEAMIQVKNIAIQHHMIIEGAAACAVSAALKIKHLNSKIVCILSGGNLSPGLLSELLLRV